MTVLIDADSLVYIIAWTYRELGTDDEVKRSCDQMLKDILLMTDATYYIGVFSDKKSFRHGVYRYSEYKGNRPEKPEWLRQWEDTIKSHFINKHGFFMIPNLEADDVVIAGSRIMKMASDPCIICSPDKDMKQEPGLLYVPKKTAEGAEKIEGQILRITEEEAYYTFWLQMICGDTSDNVAGVPGLGEVKGKKLLAECMDPMMYPSVVKGAYVKYFGTYYGRQIFEETHATLMMMCHEHPHWGTFEPYLSNVATRRQQITTTASIFDI